MAVPARSLKIGEKTFDLIEDAGAHTLQSVAGGPEGPARFFMNDWSGGALNVEDGILWPQDGTNKYVRSRGLDASFPQQLVSQPALTSLAVASGAQALSAPIKVVDFTPSGGSVSAYLAQAGRYVHRLESGLWNNVLDWGAAAESTDIISQGGKIIVGAVATYAHSTTGASGAWTAVATAGWRFGVLNQNLWRAIRPNLVTSAASATGTWTSTSDIADAGYVINSLTGLEQLLLIGKEDGIYTIDNVGATSPLTPELRPQYFTETAQREAVVTFNGDYYFRTRSGIIQITADAGQKARIGFDLLLAEPGDLGTTAVKALAADDRFLYALSDSATRLVISRRDIYGRWHGFVDVASSGQSRIVDISGALGYAALFMADGTTTRYIRLPTTANPRDDANYTYSTETGTIQLPRIGRPGAQVVLDRVVIGSEGLSAGRSIQVQYSADGGAVTNFGAAVTSGPHSSVIPTTPVTATFIDIFLQMTNNAAAATGVIKNVLIEGVWLPVRRNIHTFMVVGDTWHSNGRGGSVRRGPVETFTDITSLLDDGAVTVIDENQQTFTGYLLDVQWTSMQEDLPNREPSRVLKMVVAEKAS